MIDRKLNERICRVNESFFKERDRLTLDEGRSFYEGIFESERSSVFIYLPTYNRADFLRSRSIPSILRQSHDDFILLVVGDACDDLTQDVIEEFNDPRILFLNLPFRSPMFPNSAENRWFSGPVRAANLALANVPISAKWIARIDDDEEWIASHLEVSIATADSGDFEFVSSGNLENYTKREPVENLGFHALSPYYYPTLNEADSSSPILGCTSTWLYRSYLSKFQYNLDSWRKSHNRVNDIDFSLRLYEAGVRIGHTGRCGVITTARGEDDMIGIQAYLKEGDS